MTELNEGIVELYAEHLLKKASSAVLTSTVAGVIGGAILGAVPHLLSHSIVSPGTTYFAVLLGAISGGFFGRSLGEKRAVGLRLQARMALRELELESRAVQAPAAPVARPVAPAPAPLPAPAPVPVAAAPVAPPVAAPPLLMPPPAPAPAPAPVQPVAAPAPVEAPAPVAVPVPAPLLPAAPAAPMVPALRTEATAGAIQPVPRFDTSAPGLPPLSAMPPLSG